MNHQLIKRCVSAIRDCFRNLTFEEVNANVRLGDVVKVVHKFSGEEAIGRIELLVSPSGYLMLDDPWRGRVVFLSDIREISQVEP